MGTATIAPPLTGADIGSKIAEIGSKASEIGSKVGSQLGKVGMGALRIGGVAATAIFTSQSVGVGSDQIPGVTAGLPSDEGLNNPGIMMGDKAQTKPQARVDEKDMTCTADNPNCKNGDHRGNIQAQEEKGMLVVTPAIAVWERKKPPSYSYAVGAATSVRQALLAQKGKTISVKDGLVPGDRGDKFQEGADKAYQVLLKVLNDNQFTGIFAIPKRYELSCYFNGTRSFGANKMLKKLASRRIDLTVHKGQFMGPGAL